MIYTIQFHFFNKWINYDNHTNLQAMLDKCKHCAEFVKPDCQWQVVDLNGVVQS